MIRHLAGIALLLALAASVGPGSRAFAQGANAGGPSYRPPVPAGPTGPSLHVGAFAPNFSGPLPSNYRVPVGGGVGGPVVYTNPPTRLPPTLPPTYNPSPGVPPPPPIST